MTSQLALFYICLKLPMYDRPPFLRGVYTCFDYNYNPVARRILFVKYSDSIAREEFMKLKGELKAYEVLNKKNRCIMTIPANRKTSSECVIFLLLK